MPVGSCALLTLITRRRRLLATLISAVIGSSFGCWASIALAASPERFPMSGPHQSCPFVSVPQIYPGSRPSAIGPQEIDLFGRGAPSCAQADHLLRVAPVRITERRWGRVNGWHCVWEVGFEECKRGSVRERLRLGARGVTLLAWHAVASSAFWRRL
jgi:hypothetical protein